MDTALKDILLKLTPKQRTAFAASCAERLYPNYIAFSDEANWGNPAELRTALDAVWEHLAGQTLSPTLGKELIDQCDALIPDTEDIQTDNVSDGLDAGVAVIEALLTCIEDDPAHAVNASVCVTDTVDRHIQTVQVLDANDPEFEAKIATHQLMIRELRKQEADLRLLLRSTAIDAVIVEELKRKI